MSKNLCLLVSLSCALVILASFGIKETTAICTPDILEDWPDAPCGLPLSTEKLREDWQGYYEFKGKEWMEEKRVEMERAILSGTLEQWRSNGSNHNVWLYYKITNNIPEVPPLKQFRFGIPTNEIQCKEGFVVAIKASNDKPSCVKPATKQKLIERGWGKAITSDEDHDEQDQILDIAEKDQRRVMLNPTGTCASIHLMRLAQPDIERYKNDERGLNKSNTLILTNEDLEEIPDIRELIYAVNTLEFPKNVDGTIQIDIADLVKYETFLMNKSMQKYGDTKEDYFIKLDEDWKERLANSKREGLSNTFESPMIVYNDRVYSIGGTVFWTSNEHEPRPLRVYSQDSIGEDEKFIVLTDSDMESLPKLEEAIKKIGTIKESVTAIKGTDEEGEWNEYRNWFEQKSQEQLGSKDFRLLQYKDQLYSVGFAIC